MIPAPVGRSWPAQKANAVPRKCLNQLTQTAGATFGTPDDVREQIKRYDGVLDTPTL